MSNFVLSAFGDEIDERLERQLEVLEEHGIKHIEMRGVNGKCIVDYSLEEVKEIKRQLDERGFKLSAIGSPIGKISIVDDFESHLQLFKHTLEIARIMEVRHIRMFSFFIPQGENPNKYRDEVINRWRQFVKAAEGYDVILLHENEKDIYGDTAERCLDLLETMNCDYVKAIFDPANFVQCDVKTYPEAYELLKDHIEYMHIKDALYSDHEVVPAGHGDGKVKETLSALQDRGFEGFLSLEPHLGNFKGFAELEQGNVELKETGDGPRRFSIAAGALNKILLEIGEK